ncbi:MAG: hypothetical protein ACLSDJ_01445 [Butyricimonas faecihominis]
MDRVVKSGGLLAKVLAQVIQEKDDKRFDTSSTLDNDVNLGWEELRYRASKYIDLQLTSGVA